MTRGTPRATTAPTPSPTLTPTPTATPDPVPPSGGYEILVRGNGSLPLDPNRTYAQTLTLLDAEPTPPPSQIYLRRTEDPWRPTVDDPFARTLVDGRERSNFTRVLQSGVVVTNPHESSVLELRYTLVHEFVHHLQFRYADDTTTHDRLFDADTQDRRKAALAVWEGTASWVAHEYMVEYTNYSSADVLARTDQYPNASAAGAFTWSTYHFGRRYVDARLDSPANRSRLYENPPNTTEQVIHGLAPGSEPPASLSVTVAERNWTVAERDRLGELFVRSVLTTELPDRRAARGAAGWGTDELLRLRTADDRTAYGWAIRWDDAANATAFLGWFRAAMDARTARTDGRWVVDGTAVRVERVAPETVVVFTGPESVVANASASGQNDAVVLRSNR